MASKSAIPLSVTLSQEELFVAMLHLNTQFFPGLDLQPFQELDQKQTNLMAGVAERALIARNFLKPGANGDWQLEQKLQGLLQACLSADCSLLVRHTRPQAGSEEYFFHVFRRMYVMHSIPVTAIHQFIATDDKNAVPRAVVSILRLPDLPKAECPQGKIRLPLFEQARDLALEKGAEEAGKLLLQAGLEAPTAGEVAQTLAAPLANTTLARIEKQQTGRGFSILQGKQAIWQIEPLEEEEWIAIRPVSADEAVQVVKEIAAL